MIHSCFLPGVHASYPVPDFCELFCINSLKIDFKKLKIFLQKCPDDFEVYFNFTKLINVFILILMW